VVSDQKCLYGVKLLIEELLKEAFSSRTNYQREGVNVMRAMRKIPSRPRGAGRIHGRDANSI